MESASRAPTLENWAFFGYPTLEKATLDLRLSKNFLGPTQIEAVFGVIMRKVVRRGSFTSVRDLRDKLMNFIDYFNHVFAHPFRWTYTGRPLIAKTAA
jgi:hypothetical protein